jgi:hypothetical protein
MVCVPLDLEKLARKRHDEPIPFFEISPKAPEVPIMINREPEKSSGYWDHPIKRVSQGKIRMHFADYFDWDLAAPLDFQYCLAKIIETSEHPEIVGRYALVEVQYVRVEFVAPA